ncbi:RING finger protein 17 isoform X1 [Gadus morhua]|uniref:RING finger protein 17 isoform X1 n=1 Tax=Gadus morhua TaxID=8049 RepID=UPI0011B3EB07|nr:RING finger protein 17 isoform X1 [Gadus morhua]
MDRNISSSLVCKLCLDAYTLPELDNQGNLPHMLLCGHVFCSGCLLSLEDDKAVLCPDCAVESSLPEGGVYGLEVESRIIGLVYTVRMKKIKSERTVLGSGSNRAARHCWNSQHPTQRPNVSTDDGKTAEDTVSTNNVMQADTGKATDTVPTGSATPTSYDGQDSGKAKGDATKKCKQHGKGKDMDDVRDGEALKEKGHVAHPDQCVEPPADGNKVEKLVDEALTKAAENLAHLEQIQQILLLGQSLQAKREEERMRTEVNESVFQANQLLLERQEVLLRELKAMEVHFPSTEVQLERVQKRIEAVENAVRKARQVRLHPSLELYCDLHMVLETLQAPVIRESYDLSCVTLGSGVSCVLQTDSLSDCLNVCLILRTGSPKPLTETSLPEQLATGPLPTSGRLTLPKAEALRWTPPAVKEVEGEKNEIVSPKKEMAGSPHREKEQHAAPPPVMVRSDREDQASDAVSGSRSEPTTCLKPKVRALTTVEPPAAPRPLTPDVVIEAFIEEEEEEQRCEASPPTGPELANNKWRTQKKKTRLAIAPLKQGPVSNASVYPWVELIYVLNPNHFYVRYVAELREAAMLSQKINQLISRLSSFFRSGDTLETGSQVLVNDKVHRWCRGTVVRLSKIGMDDVTSCPAHLLTSASLFLLDHGVTSTVNLNIELGEGMGKMSVVKEHLRKMDDDMKMELSGWTPLAIRCSLKDLVPADLQSGWANDAQEALLQAVGSAVVQLQLFSREGDYLLVDLRKPAMDSASPCPLSVRDFLVFMKVASFYSPSTNRSALLFYPPIQPGIPSDHSALVTHINTPQDFYIQLVGNMEFQLLSSKLQTCYGSLSLEGSDWGLQLYCPTLMQPCVARFRDNLWYRARITGMLGDRSVEVQYVDIGNEGVVSVSDLRKIKDEFFSLPAMAIQCSLADVIPADGVTWSQACSDRLSSLVLNKPVTILAIGEMLSKQQLEVRLLEGGIGGPEVDVAALLVSEHLACFRDGYPSPQINSEIAMWNPPIDEEQVSLEPRPQPPVSQDSEPCPQLQLPTVLTNIEVAVTHFTSPGSFFVQLAQNEALFERLSERVQQFAEASDFIDMVWKENMFCAALVNGVWERAQILTDVSSDNIAEVQRCDFGSRVKLPVSSLRPLKPALQGSLALECKLADIRPAGGPNWTATACNLFSCHLDKALLMMTIKEVTEERPLSVVLSSLKVGKKGNLAHLLASQGVALKERKPSEASKAQAAAENQGGGDTQNKRPTTAPQPTSIALPSLTPRFSSHADSDLKPAPRTYQSAEKVRTELYKAPDLPGPGHSRMRVSAVGEDCLIYLQTIHAESQLEVLRTRIEGRMKVVPQKKPYTWKSVLGCALMGIDMLWYRGQVLEVLREMVKVRYVDYGLVENVPVVHVYPMLLCEEVPQLCMPCHLNAVIPVGRAWEKDAVGLLKELLINRTVDVQVLEVPGDPRRVLTVEIFLDGLPLSKILCHHHHANMDMKLLSQQVATATPCLPNLDHWELSLQGLCIPEKPPLGPFTYSSLPPEGSQFRVTVKHICTPNEMFIWVMESGRDSDVNGLDEMLSSVTADVAQLPRLSSFPLGGACLAEYGDGMYYRARLMEFSSLDPVRIMVQHVDYGSDDILPTNKLRAMPEELLRFPARAVKVKAAGFRPPKVRPDIPALPYAPQWTIEALDQMLKPLHGKLTATVLTLEPEPTLLLYNERGELVHLPLVASGLADADGVTPGPPSLVTPGPPAATPRTLVMAPSFCKIID